MEDYEGVQCRSCLSTTASEYIYMESSMSGGCSYMECFNICTDLRATVDDNLPGTICVSCSHDLEIAYNFVVGAQQADAFLREHLQEHKSRQDIEQLEELDCVLTDDEVEAKEVDILDESQMETLREDYECEELETVEEELVPEDIKVENEMPQANQINSIGMQYYKNIKEEQQDLISSQYYSEDERDDEYLIEYDDAENIDSSMAVLQNNQGTKWKCIECKRVLRGHVSYEGHMNMHKNVKPYKCTKCISAFRCKYALERHVCERHGDNVIRLSTQKNICCDICEKVFGSSELLQEHQQTEHRMQLGICSNSFETKEDTSIHMRLMHPTSNITQIQEHCTPFEKSEIWEHPPECNKDAHTSENPNDKSIKSQWQCNICFNYFRSRNLLKNHRSSHINERPYACNVCAKRFTSTKNLRSHMRTVHQEEFKKHVAETEEEFVTCEICNKNLLKKNIEKHLLTHERKEKESTDGTVKYLCTYCPRECKNQKTLNHHEKLHQTGTSGVVYHCEECERQYATQQHLDQHRKQAHKERDNVCPICGNAFKLKNQLVNHMKLHLEKNIPCPHCDKKYARLFDLNVHMRSHTGELPYGCYLCEKRFAIKVRLTYHLQKHMGVKHRCKECGAEFNSKQKLKAHSYKHTGMPYRCETCDNHGFANRDVFKRHLLRVHNATMSDELLVAMFQRNTAKSFKNIYDIKSHESTHNPSRTRNFSCEYCDMKFFKLHLKMHHIKYVHSTDRRIVCPVCGRTYKEKSTLSTHLKTHAEKRFPCTQCEKKYTRLADLTVHMRTHTGELPYKCDLCEKRFAIKVRLTYHLQDHLDAKHKCKICGKVFISRYQLRGHKFEHTGFPYICEDCPNARFYKRDRFRGHIMRHHKRTPSEEELTANFRRNSDKTLF